MLVAGSTSCLKVTRVTTKWIGGRFDNLLQASVSLMQVMTLEGWGDLVRARSAP